MESSTSRKRRPPPLLTYAVSLVVLWLVTRRSSRRRVSRHDYHVGKKRDDMNTVLTDIDLTPEEVSDFEEAAGITTVPQDGAEADTEETAACTRDNERPEREDGTCGPGFEKSENGCCVLPRTIYPSLALELASSIGVEVASSVANDFLPQLMKMIMKRTGADTLASKKFARTIANAKAGRGLVKGALTRLQTKINTKVSATASKAVARRTASAMAGQFAKKLALTFATKMAKAMAKLGSPLILFELFSMALDMADPEGYNTFVSNQIIDQARDVAAVQLENEAKRTGREFPMIFPIDVAFSKAYEMHVLPAIQDEFLNDAMDRLTEYDLTVLFECLVDETDIPEDIAITIGEYVEEVMNADPTRRDDCIWRALTKEAHVNKRYIARYPHMSSATRVGVSLSRDGVIWWNQTHREEWFKYNDLFQKVPDMPENYAPPPVALWSKSFRRLHPTDPGTADEPNMVTEDIQGGFVPLYLPAGHIVSYCEKERDALFMGGLMGDIPDANDGVDPKKFGVYFDDGTGELGIPSCVYTKGYCQRMGLQHSLNIPKGVSDCWKDGGQDVAESLFGTTVSRGVSRAFQSAFGFVCNPECKITEYCEGFKCHPKRKVGEDVGVTAGWKCLTGMEDWSKCAECKRGTDCDELRSTRKGLDCYEKGTCYCEFGTCEYKKNVGEHVGLTAGWKCLSDLEAFAKCVECKGTAGSGNGACDKAYPDKEGTLYCEGDKCHPKKGTGANVGWTARWKCLSGQEINGRCHDGEGSLDKGTDVAYTNGRFCKPYGRGSVRRADGTYDTSAESGPAWTETTLPVFKMVTPPTTRKVGKCTNRGRPVDENGNEIQCSMHTTKDKCMSHTVGACTSTSETTETSVTPDCTGTSETCTAEGCEWLTNNVCHWSETTEIIENPGEPYNEQVGERVKRSRPAAGAEEGGKCMGPCKGNAVDVGWNRGKFCCSGTEINGRCHDGEGSLPYGTDVGFHNQRFCESGMEDMGKCSECKDHGHCDAITGKSVDGHDCSDGKCFCEHGKCHNKRKVGKTVGLTAGWKCLSGLEAFEKCVECKGPLGAGNANCDALHGTNHVIVDQKTGRKEWIGKKYCEGDKCHNRKGVGSNAGWTAGWKCMTGREINGRCHAGEGSLNPGTDVAYNNGKYCKAMGRVFGGAEEGGKCMGQCSADQTNVGWNRGKFCCSGWEVGGYCVSKYHSLDNGKKPGIGQGLWCKSGQEHFGTCVQCKSSEHCPGGQYCEHERCHNKHGYGANVGWTAGWKCVSGMENGGRCIDCNNDNQCSHGHFCEDNGRCTKKYGEGHGCHGGRKCESDRCHHNLCARQGAAKCWWGNDNSCDNSYKRNGIHRCHHELCIKPPP